VHALFKEMRNVIGQTLFTAGLNLVHKWCCDISWFKLSC